jgi:hypothetical protein
MNEDLKKFINESLIATDKAMKSREVEIIRTDGKLRRQSLRKMIKPIPLFRRLDLEFGIIKDWYYQEMFILISKLEQWSKK